MVPSWGWYLGFYLAWLHVLHATQTPFLAMLAGLQPSVGGTIFHQPASVEHIGILGPLGHLYPGKYKDKIASTYNKPYENISSCGNISC